MVMHQRRERCEVGDLRDGASAPLGMLEDFRPGGRGQYCNRILPSLFHEADHPYITQVGREKNLRALPRAEPESIAQSC